MSEQLTNGNFSSGLAGWTNGIEGARAFVAESGMARAISDDDDAYEKYHRMTQGFGRYDEVISGNVDVDYQWDCGVGNTSSGAARFIVGLKKPDSSIVELANVLKSGSGSGALLTNKDIKSYLNQNGTYYLRLEARVKSAKQVDSESDDCDTPYGSWTNYWMTLYGSNYKCFRSSPVSDLSDYEGYVTKSFYSSANPDTANVSVYAKGIAETTVIQPGDCKIQVILIRPGLSDVYLFNQSMSDNTWWEVVNNMDISGYLTVSGTYYLRLKTIVRTAKDYLNNTYISEGHFGACDLNVSKTTTTYPTTKAYFDNASVDKVVKKTQVLTEQIGTIGVDSRESSIVKSETAILSESHSYIHEVAKVFESFLENMQLSESVAKKITLNILEYFVLAETPYYGAMKVFSDTDIAVFDEIFDYFVRKFTTQSDEVSFGEWIGLVRQRGNVRITYTPIVETAYGEVIGPETNWRKEWFRR